MSDLGGHDFCLVCFITLETNLVYGLSNQLLNAEPLQCSTRLALSLSRAVDGARIRSGLGIAP